MIPRFRPTFSNSDILQALGMCRNGQCQEQLQVSLRTLYGVEYVFLLDSGRSALTVLLRALQRSGEVILPAYTCPAVPVAVKMAGMSLVFADVRPGNVNCDWPSFKSLLNSNTTAVIWTHQFGCINSDSAELVNSLPRDIVLIEDLAAAFGAPLFCGNYSGRYAALISFGFTKVLSAGACGAILTNSEEIAEAVAFQMPRFKRRNIIDAVRNCAWNALCSPVIYGSFANIRGYLHKKRGTIVSLREELLSPRLPSEFVCALVLIQLPRLRENLAHRRIIGKIYEKEIIDNSINNSAGVTGWDNAWVQYPVCVSEKYAFIRYLNRHGADATWSYEFDCCSLLAGSSVMGAAWNAEHMVGLPCYPKLTLENAERIAKLTVKWKRREEAIR